MRTRAKICGITRIEDALSAIEHGADAIGLVFYPPSPRHVSIEQAAAIAAALPPFVTVVALFVNPTETEVNEVISKVHIDLLQFHGDESEATCMQYRLPYLKAVRVKESTNLIQYAQTYSSAKALLLDTYSDRAVGGTGQVFDWNLIPENISLPIVLAGGLTSENVTSAIQQIHPYAVDVSGGVEQSKGIKDTTKIATFMSAVKASY
ncbi:MAG: phosphoribosylanthranilate isomerase [Methylophilaceae bacterium]|nr:MAG: phosphoribosylanthranilate isomerase [Methylophilaceae bacterium]